jgi:hypothetical protein
LLAIEVLGPRAFRHHAALAKRMASTDPAGLLEAKARAREIEVGRSREWWRKHSQEIGTDWSTLLRQRLRVLWWVRAGRPPISDWQKDKKG